MKVPFTEIRLPFKGKIISSPDRTESAQRIAMIYSLLATCKTNEIDPMKWLTHVLEELPNRTVDNIDDLLPQKGNG